MYNILMQIALPLAQLAPTAQAPAQKAPTSGGPLGAAGGGSIQMILMMAGMVAIFYFMIIRPQSKQQKERKQMLDAIKVGDKILTNGGMYGQITKLGKTTMTVRVANNVEIRMSRSAIASRTSKDEKDED